MAVLLDEVLDDPRLLSELMGGQIQLERHNGFIGKQYVLHFRHCCNDSLDYSVSVLACFENGFFQPPHSVVGPLVRRKDTTAGHSSREYTHITSDESSRCYTLLI